jgi:hypothetical protein
LSYGWCFRNLGSEALASTVPKWPNFFPHDTWGYDVKIKRFVRNDASRSYTAELEIEIFDHYGLDELDIDFNVKPVFAALVGFRSWFVLQHSQKFNKKPFYTIIKFNETIKGPRCA